MSAPRESVLEDTRQDQQVSQPRLWRVLLHNDDYTTQDFVVWVLETVFQKAAEEAVAIMLAVHRGGVGVAGVFTRDVAETKARVARQYAEQQEYPLRVTTEPVP
ncbi:MAG: ATP-dependent Clp protease adaptor ClpS [Vicinamibacterales bacterium]